MNWRLASRLSVITLAALVVVFVALWGLRAHGQTTSNALPTATPGASLSGSDLGGTAAPNFTLTDQNGKPIALAQFRGEPVVLTFLDTHSATEGPALADKLAEVIQSLGKQARQVAVLAVSVDPQGDTVASVTQFSQAHHLLTSWHYLMGTRKQLAAVWKAYAIGVSAAPTVQIGAGGSVTYTPAIYVIDQQGRERVYLDDSFMAAQLTTDLQLLLQR